MKKNDAKLFKNIQIFLAKIQVFIKWMNIKHRYINGTWFNYDFSDIKEVLYEEMYFPKIESSDAKNSKVFVTINESNSVSIHIRRGDYLKCGYLTLSEDYYLKAIAYMQRIIDNPHSYVFSDDIEESRMILENVDAKITYGSSNSGVNAYKKFTANVVL